MKQRVLFGCLTVLASCGSATNVSPTTLRALNGSNASSARRKAVVSGRGSAASLPRDADDAAVVPRPQVPRLVADLGGGGSSPSGASADSPLRRRLLFVATYLVYASLYFARKPLSVLKPVLVEEMGFSRASLGWVDTALLAGYAVGQLLLGRICAEFTTRQVLTASMLVSGLACAGMGLCDTANGMAALSGVVGLFAACVNPLFVLFISDLFPPAVRATAVGLWQTSSQMGGILANNGAAWLYSLRGWRFALGCSGLLVASMALPANVAMYQTPKRVEMRGAAARDKQRAEDDAARRAHAGQADGTVYDIWAEAQREAAVAAVTSESRADEHLSAAELAAKKKEKQGKLDKQAAKDKEKQAAKDLELKQKDKQKDKQGKDKAAEKPKQPKEAERPRLTAAEAAAAMDAKSAPAASKANKKPPGKGPAMGTVVAAPGVSSVAVSYALAKMCRYCLMLWLPTFFKSKVGMGAATAGAMASLFDAGGVAGGVFAGVATDALLGGRLVACSFAMSVACAATFAVWAAVVAGGDAAAVSGGGGGQSVRLNALAMLAAGFTISGPDGILGGAVSKNLCEYNGKGAKGDGWGPAVAGYVNGVASVGVMGMSALTPQLLGLLGWSGLFGLLAAMMAAAAALSLPAALLEARHFSSVAASSKKK